MEMTAIATLNEIRSQVQSLLNAAGLENALNNNRDESKVLYHESKVESKEDASKETYCVYTILSMEPLTLADNKVRKRDAYVSINIYTRKDSRSSAIKLLIQNINNAAENTGWKFEVSEINYDEALRVSYMSFDITKAI